MHLQQIQFVKMKFMKREKLKIKSCEINNKIQFNLIYLRKQNRILKYMIQKLKNMINNNKDRQILKKVLTDDQIQALFTKNRSIRN